MRCTYLQLQQIQINIYCVTIKENICSKAKIQLYILARTLLNKGKFTNILYMYLFSYTFNTSVIRRVFNFLIEKYKPRPEFKDFKEFYLYLDCE